MTVTRRKKVKSNGLIIISLKEVHEKSIVFALVAMEIVGDSLDEKPKKVSAMLKEFQDIFPFELFDVLPLIRNIQHVIDFVPSATLSNLPHYRMNPSDM
jgi:hypothetical protein